MDVRFDFDNGDEGMDGGGKREEDCTDGVFHGGDVDVASGIVSAVAGGDRRHHDPFPFTLKLHMRHVLRFKGTLSSLRFQILLNRYTSSFHPQIYHHHLCIFDVRWPGIIPWTLLRNGCFMFIRFDSCTIGQSLCFYGEFANSGGGIVGLFIGKAKASFQEIMGNAGFVPFVSCFRTWSHCSCL